MLDQQQALFGSTGSLAIGGGPNSDQKLGQVVIAGIAGTLISVGLVVACDGDSALLLQIQEAPLQGPSRVLSSQLVSGIGPAFPSTFRQYGLATPLPLYRGQQFAIVVHSSGSCGMRPAPDGDSYPAAHGYFDARPNPPGWLCLCGFAAQPWDLPFQTFVEPQCIVTAVDGRALREAVELLERSGCTLGAVKRVYSNNSPVNEVISQTPAPGTILAPGSPVALTVSRGPQPCVVPNVRQLTLKRAKVRLAKSGCRLGHVRRTTARLRVGLVVSQRPTPGRRLRPGARVDVIVSLGPRK